MAEDLEKFLNEIHFDKYFRKLSGKIRNKSVIIYGVGKLFQTIKAKYDISKWNIIAVSDRRFLSEEDFQGFKAVPPEKMTEYAPDYVIVAALEYDDIIENIELKYFNKTRTKVIPLAKKTFMYIFKQMIADYNRN